MAGSSTSIDPQSESASSVIMETSRLPLHLQSPRELSCFRLCRRRVTYHLRERQRISILPLKTSFSNSLCSSQIMALLDRDCRSSTTCVSMVLDHLHESCSRTAPASSAASERAFSRAGLLMRPKRSRLSKANFSKLVFLGCNGGKLL